MAYILPLLLLAAVYAVILPRRRQAQLRRAAAQSAAPGDRVLIGGCIAGTLLDADDEMAHVEVAPGVVLDIVPRTYRKIDPPAPLLAQEPGLPADDAGAAIGLTPPGADAPPPPDITVDTDHSDEEP